MGVAFPFESVSWIPENWNNEIAICKCKKDGPQVN